MSVRRTDERASAGYTIAGRRLAKGRTSSAEAKGAPLRLLFRREVFPLGSADRAEEDRARLPARLERRLRQGLSFVVDPRAADVAAGLLEADAFRLLDGGQELLGLGHHLRPDPSPARTAILNISLDPITNLSRSPANTRAHSQTAQEKQIPSPSKGRARVRGDERATPTGPLSTLPLAPPLKGDFTAV